jgi:hypothetical protein
MKKAEDEQRKAAMVRISPAVHEAMRRHVESNGLVQKRFVDNAIMSAIEPSNGVAANAGKTRRPTGRRPRKKK